MIREEEILQQAKAYAKANRLAYPEVAIEHGFIHGAEWADEHPINYDGKAMLHVLNKSAEQAKKQMIDRACEWWENEFTYPSMTSEEIEWYKQKVNDFRKAMKE